MLDDVRSSHVLSLAVDGWIEDNPDIGMQFLPDDSPQMQARWRDITARTARSLHPHGQE